MVVHFISGCDLQPSAWRPLIASQRFRVRHRFLLTVVSILALLTAASVSGDASTPPPDPTDIKNAQPSDFPPPNPDPPYMTSTDNVTKLGETKYPDVYAGVYVHDDAAPRLDVYLTGDSVKVENDFQQAAGDTRVTFYLVGISKQNLDALEARLAAATPKLAEEGVQIAVSYPHMQTGRLHIEVVKLADGDSQKIQDAIGSDLFDVYNTDALLSPTSRRDDTSPWYGGDAIYNTSTGGCSTGITVRGSDGYLHPTTASHCFTYGMGVRNGICTGSGCPGAGSSGTLLGYVHPIDEQTTGGTDSAIISASGSASVILGSPTSSTAAHVDAAHSTALGYQICNDGAYSGDLCSITVQDLSANVSFNDEAHHEVRTFPGQIHGTGDGGGLANQSGNSGGPVVKSANGNLYGLGIVSASGATHACTYVYSGATCYKDLYYTGIYALMADLNASMP